MPRFYETTLSITNLHNLSISTHVNRSRIYYSMPLRKGARVVLHMRYSLHCSLLKTLKKSVN